MGGTIGAERQRQAVESYISKLARAHQASCNCVWLSKPDRMEIDCPSARLQVRLRALKNGRLLVPMEVLCGKRRMRTVWHRLLCRVEKRVPVAARRIRRGELITPDAVELGSVPIELARDAAVGVEAVVGKRARCSIASGSVIKPRMLEVPKPVEKGDPLVVVFSRDGLRITAIAIAQESGVVGSVIPVMNAQSRRVFFARIVEHGEVEPLVPTGGDDESD